MKKATRKLIPALAMLLISAVMMSTASFAWFSMNTSVSATGMSVQAKNESKYLQIVAGAGTAFTDAAHRDAIAIKASNILRPTALVKSLADDRKSTEEYAGGTDLVWVEAFSSDPNSPAMMTGGTYNNVSTSAMAETDNFYTLYNIFKVRMNPTTGVTTGGPLSVTGVKVTSTGANADKLLPAVRVAIIGTEGGAIYDSTGTLVSGIAQIIDNVTTTESQVKVFVFFDGENDKAFTNNVPADATYAVEFTLGIA
jgi:hypothetical protein